MYADNDEGFYTEQRTLDGLKDFLGINDRVASLKDLEEKIKSGDIVFKKGAKVVFLGCNTGNNITKYKKGRKNPFAKEFSKVVGKDVKVIGADGFMSSKNNEAKKHEASLAYYSTRGDGYSSSTGLVTNAAPGRWRTYINGELDNVSKSQIYRIPHK